MLEPQMWDAFRWGPVAAGAVIIILRYRWAAAERRARESGRPHDG